MPIAWRLAPAGYARKLDGGGNRVTGARWNSPGRGVVYASANLSLCVLETYVHMPAALRSDIPEFHAVCLWAPDDAGATYVTVSEFQTILSASDPRASFRAIGDQWLGTSSNLVLLAPSVVVPEELNVLLNPAHPRMAEVKIESARIFNFDPRMTTGMQ